MEFEHVVMRTITIYSFREIHLLRVDLRCSWVGLVWIWSYTI